jgi:stage II sporulation protein AA (anti-sigma F factor antagonist)
MQIISEQKAQTLRVQLIGELDHHQSARVRQTLDNLLTQEIRLLELDLSGLSFMDSSGIGVLIGRYKILQRRGGGVRVVRSNPQVDRLMKMAGLDTIFDRT